MKFRRPVSFDFRGFMFTPALDAIESQSIRLSDNATKHDCTTNMYIGIDIYIYI